jgi:hypothetical protein
MKTRKEKIAFPLLQNGQRAARAKKQFFKKGTELNYTKKNPLPRFPEWPASRKNDKHHF